MRAFKESLKRSFGGGAGKGSVEMRGNMDIIPEEVDVDFASDDAASVDASMDASVDASLDRSMNTSIHALEKKTKPAEQQIRRRVFAVPNTRITQTPPVAVVEAGGWPAIISWALGCAIFLFMVMRYMKPPFCVKDGVFMEFTAMGYACSMSITIMIILFAFIFGRRFITRINK